MIELQVPNLACSACVKTVTTAIQGIDAEAKFEADPKTKLVAVETDQLESAIAAVAYPSA